MVKIVFICHGNICRSPMAEFVLKDMVKKCGVAHDFFIESRATSTEEIGNGVHHGTTRKLAQCGISTAGKTAIQLRKSDYEKYDYLICMDSWNVRNTMRIIGSDKDGKVTKLLSFAGEGGDIADPWYTGNFDVTYDDIVKGLNAFFRSQKKEILNNK